MKIAYFIESLPPHIDGVSRTYRHLAESLLNKDNDFVYFSPFKPPNDYAWAKHVVSVPWVRVPFYEGYRFSLPCRKKLFKEIDKFKPDIIHCSTPSYLSFVALKYAKIHGIKTATSFHTDFASYLSYYNIDILEKIIWLYLRYFYNRFDLVLVPSNDTKELLESHKIEKLSLWKRGVDTKLFSPKYKDNSFRAKYNADKKPILLFVGRLEKEKDLDDIVLADKHLKKDNLSYNIIFVGDGAMKGELRKKLGDAIFLGYKSNKELSIIYASSDILIFPSTTETFGNVIQEACASGIPSIGVRKGGVPDLIDDGLNGFIAKPNNPKDFADKIKALLLDKDLLCKMKENTKPYSTKRSWENINSTLLDNYTKLLQT